MSRRVEAPNQYRFRRSHPLHRALYCHAISPVKYDAGGKAPRYQVDAINAAVETIANGRQRFLLVMATGTGRQDALTSTHHLSYEMNHANDHHD